MDPFQHNRRAWNELVRQGNRWTVPASPEDIAKARAGSWEVVLTPRIPVPRSWFGDVDGAEILCLASGGGQQGPILAAAGARVTVFDASPEQLVQDRRVAERENLHLQLREGDMRDLSAFADSCFDMVFHPVSNCFVPDIRPVWLEAARVLRPGGTLLAGFANPVLYLFPDNDSEEGGDLTVRYSVPYSDIEDLPPHELERRIARGTTMEFGHTLADQIGGQLAAGFVLTDMFEDRPDPEEAPLARHIATYLATRAVRR
jgi:SAM-dependent methyltransferase